MQDYQKLTVWDRAHRFALAVHKLAGTFPVAERYGLTAQLRRATMSIPTNIAEGSGRNSPAEFGHFIGIACGSANEAEYQLLMARDLGYLPADVYEQSSAEIREIRRMLTRLRQVIGKKR
jgi:four helix bundle protein